jgi:hypothetical protein
MVDSKGGGDPVRAQARRRENATAQGVRRSEACRNATVEPALELGGALRGQAGAGNGDEVRGGRRAVRVAVACMEEGSKGANSTGVEERMTRGG